VKFPPLGSGGVGLGLGGRGVYFGFARVVGVSLWGWVGGLGVVLGGLGWVFFFCWVVVLCGGGFPGDRGKNQFLTVTSGPRLEFRITNLFFS